MTMKLCVIGLGYIGLPTAIMFAKHNVEVHGVDINTEVIKGLALGNIHIEEPGLQEMLDEVMDSGRLSFGTIAQPADAFIISVPTPIKADKSANLDYVVQATQSILPYIKKNNLIILESTVPPRTVEDVMMPLLEQTRLNVKEDLYISHSPERVLPGNLLEELVYNDRIVGGVNTISSERTAELYRKFVKGTIHLTDATTAEMVKLMENTYRDVNIAFANEMAKIAENVGFNVWDAIELANCHPRVNIHKPGPGVGGHCIAVDPWFIYESAPTIAKLIHTSREINDSMPSFVVQKLKSMFPFPAEAKIAILGLSFKGNIDDIRESPAVTVVSQLLKVGFQLSVFDPHVGEKFPNKEENLEDTVKGAHAILVLTDHREFKEVDSKEMRNLMKGNIVLDTRNILDLEKWTEAGFSSYVLGGAATNALRTKINAISFKGGE
ncbi:nucleotide sugar dehydrogenase [Paenibacillus sp. SZ31]|uniref:nucleotide sugar dehydrogenase n=1 Tax=Paenibacillus sp. SZ31 TaxID=2725555 RepID=UPI00146E22CD|nr:nucleotide sugar dehydrogenase [Paenibacillus sp. SZ31]